MIEGQSLSPQRRAFQTGAKLLVLVFLSVALLSCEAVNYYTQAARGQLAIMLNREDIEHLIADGNLSDAQREKFQLVRAIREFAEHELMLPVGDNYSTFVAIDREHVVWNVFAAPEFSTEAMNWCYPIAGCVSYRGYFSENAAIRYAQKLSDDGLDVYTGGVDAYSTLGWFDDSLLSTVMNRADYQLAGLIFHELAHQVVYVQGDTTFNESFATAVEREGVKRWLRHSGQEDLIRDAENATARQAEFVALVIQWRDQFSALYKLEIDEAEMRARKQSLQSEMRTAYEEAKRSWGGYSGYDSWFNRSLNNAQLSTVASYNDLVPQFNALLGENNGDLTSFYAAVEDLAGQEPQQRAEILDSF